MYLGLLMCYSNRDGAAFCQTWVSFRDTLSSALSPMGLLEREFDKRAFQMMMIEEKDCHEITTRILSPSFPCTLPSFISASLNCSPIAINLSTAGILPGALSPSWQRKGEDLSNSVVMNWRWRFTQWPLSGKWKMCCAALRS